MNFFSAALLCGLWLTSGALQVHVVHIVLCWYLLGDVPAFLVLLLLVLPIIVASTLFVLFVWFVVWEE